MADNFFVFIIYSLLRVLRYGLIIYAILSWLIAFNVINTRNNFVHTIYDALDRAFEPLMRPIRRIIPNLGGIDLSFLVLYILVVALENLITGNLSLI